MKIELSKIEKKLFSGTRLDLAQGALIASGVKTQKELDSYLSKISMLCKHIEAETTGDYELQKAKSLFDWLWQKKPNRSERQGSFKLTEVIDTQLDPDIEKVGNCLGLTVLYNVLAQSLGLEVKSIHVEDAFSKGPHVFSTLYTAQGTIDIENILSSGFDFKGHLHNPQRTEWDDAELIADIYHSIGNQYFEQRDLENAMQSYTKAIKLNPRYTKAYLNRAIALFLLGRDEEARQDFDHA